MVWRLISTRLFTRLRFCAFPLLYNYAISLLGNYASALSLLRKFFDTRNFVLLPMGPKAPPHEGSKAPLSPPKEVWKEHFVLSRIASINFWESWLYTSGFDMQLCFGVRIDWCWGVSVQLSQGARGDIRLQAHIVTGPSLRPLRK